MCLGAGEDPRRFSLGEDHYEQPGNLLRLLDPARQQLLFENTARAMSGVAQLIRQRHIDNCTKADPAYGRGVAEALERLVPLG